MGWDGAHDHGNGKGELHGGGRGEMGEGLWRGRQGVPDEDVRSIRDRGKNMEP